MVRRHTGVGAGPRHERVASLDGAAVQRLLGTSRLGRRLEVLATVESTNDAARSLATASAVDGTVVIAEEQTAGRGRRGRPWASPPGLGIYMSVLLKPSPEVRDYATSIQFVAGIAVAEALQPELPESVELRWPNDCYCNGRKLAGILVEAEGYGSSVSSLVCGIGINVNHGEKEIPPSLRHRATSMYLLAGRSLSRTRLIAAVLTALERWDEVARQQGLDPILERWRELSPGVEGWWVEVETADGWLRGCTAGLAETGALRVDTGDEIHEITVGRVREMGLGGGP